MVKRLEPKHSVYPNLQSMLNPTALSELLGRPISRIDCQPMKGHSGLAGGQLSFVDTDAGRLVLKKMAIASDWIMHASHDRRCRSVMLWQYGLLDQLIPHLEHKILACTQENNTWAILMKDLSGQVFSSDHHMPQEVILLFLDALAKLHSIYWNDPVLHDQRLGLCDTTRLLDQTSLPIAWKYHGTTMGLIPIWVVGGWEVMQEIIEPEVFEWMRQMIYHPQLLLNALERCPATLLHGDYRMDNLAYPGQPVALDWQEATRGLMTIDLAWFSKAESVRNSIGQPGAINYYRQRLEMYLNHRFDDQEWQMMVNLGCLVDALRSTCFEAYWYKHTQSEQQREIEMQAVLIHQQQVREAMRTFSQIS